MREPYDELSEIKREIIESRGLVIKTNNLTNALSADLKSIAKRQQSYERRLWWNSATAYLVFVVVAFTFLKFAWDARVDAIKSETEQKTQESERLRKEVRDSEKREEDRGRLLCSLSQQILKDRDLVTAQMPKRPDACRGRTPPKTMGH